MKYYSKYYNNQPVKQVKVKESVRFIWKCRNKSCKHVWAFDYTQNEGSLKEAYYRLLSDGSRRWLVEDHMILRCPDCNCNLPKGVRVEGTYNPEHVCNAKCMSATSGVCSCSCGGANHGCNHL